MIVSSDPIPSDKDIMAISLSNRQVIQIGLRNVVEIRVVYSWLIGSFYLPFFHIYRRLGMEDSPELVEIICPWVIESINYVKVLDPNPKPLPPIDYSNLH